MIQRSLPWCRSLKYCGPERFMEPSYIHSGDQIVHSFIRRHSQKRTPFRRVPGNEANQMACSLIRRHSQKRTPFPRAPGKEANQMACSLIRRHSRKRTPFPRAPGKEANQMACSLIRRHSRKRTPFQRAPGKEANQMEQYDHSQAVGFGCHPRGCSTGPQSPAETPWYDWSQLQCQACPATYNDKCCHHCHTM